MLASLEREIHAEADDECNDTQRSYSIVTVVKGDQAKDQQENADRKANIGVLEALSHFLRQNASPEYQ